jgi:hypothetical protein
MVDSGMKYLSTDVYRTAPDRAVRA